MKYLPLITIRLKHTYYENGQCPDFSVSANADTLRLLTNHRCVIKPNAYGLDVYAPIENLKPLIPLDSRGKCVFDLTLQTEAFASFTDKKFKTSTEDIQLTCDGVIWEGTSLDKELPTGIKIQRDFNQITATLSTDEIRFFAKPMFWVYYVVSNANNVDNLAIIENSSTTTTAWQKRASVSDNSVYGQLHQQYADKAIACFISPQAVDWDAVRGELFQLKQGNDIVLSQLPRPNYRNKIEVKDSGSSKEAIFQVIKYFSNSTM